MTNDQRKLVLVVDTDQRFVDDLRPQLTSHRVLSARDLDEAREIVLGGRVDLALLGPAFASDVAISSARSLLTADPSLEIALAADVVTNRLLKAALRGGFIDVLDTPVSARDLDDVMRQVGSRPTNEMSFVVEPMDPGEVAAVAQAPVAPAPVVSVPATPSPPAPVPSAPVPSAPGATDPALQPYSPPLEVPVALVPEPLAPAVAPPAAPVTDSVSTPVDASFTTAPVSAVEPPVAQPAPAPTPVQTPAAPVIAVEPPVAQPAPAPAAVEPAAPVIAVEPPVAQPAPAPAAVEPAAPVIAAAPPVAQPAPAPAEPAALPPMQFEVAPRVDTTPVVAPAAPVPTAPPVIPMAPTPTMTPEPEVTPEQPAPTIPPQTAVPTPQSPSAFVPEAEAPNSRTAVLDQVLPPPPSTPPPMPTERPTPSTPRVSGTRPPVSRSGPGKVIAVMAGKGGSGKTVTATNLAIAIGMRSDLERVAIVDADLQFGDVALLLQLDPVRTLDDVVGQVDRMSDERLDAALLRHESGLRVLPAPLLPVRAGEISAKSVVEVVDRLRSIYDTIVVDTGPVFDDGLITMLEHADQVITVVDMDLPSVKNAKVALDGLRQVGFDMDRIRLVVNRVNSKARLDLVELERSLGLRVGGSIPSDRLVPQSVNEGIPLLALSPRSKVARAFHALAESLDVGADRERITSR